MVSYTQNELLSITDFTKSISKVLSNLKGEIDDCYFGNFLCSKVFIKNIVLTYNLIK